MSCFKNIADSCGGSWNCEWTRGSGLASTRPTSYRRPTPKPRGGSRNTSPSAGAKRKELAQQMQRALAQLNAADRELLVLRYYEGLSNQEIGIVLELESSAVSKRHGRALVKLHEIVFSDRSADSE